MMKPFDRNMFTQIGLDSGSLTILGAVIHSFGEPGEYRGSAAREGDQAVFFITVDKNSPVAQANIDLATLAKPEQPSKECCESEEARNRFSVNPKGYAAMAALFSGFALVRESLSADVAAKIIVLTLVILAVNIAWLYAGAALTRFFREPRINRIINVTFAILLLASVGLALL